MKTVFTVAALALLVVGCGESTNEVDRAITAHSDGQQTEILRTLHDAGILQTPGDVDKITTILEMTCPFLNFPGATPKSVQVMHETLNQQWQMNVTMEQTRKFQAAQQDYCVNR
jgi:hypothetical protein